MSGSVAVRNESGGTCLPGVGNRIQFGRGLAWLVLGDGHRELRSFPGPALHTDMALVRLDDGFDEAQAEAKAPLRAALVAAVKARPNPVLLLLGDADAGV